MAVEKMKPLCGWPHYGPKCCVLDRDECDGEHVLGTGPGDWVARMRPTIVRRQKIDKDGTRRPLT